MLDERMARREGFREGRWVCLSDGRRWSLPVRLATEDDPEFELLLLAIRQAEDRNEQLLGELALTIFLLMKNYQLHSSDIQSLLQFGLDETALACLQRDVHALVVASLGFEADRGRVAMNKTSLSVHPGRSWSLGWFWPRRRGASRVSSQPSTPVA